MHKIDTNIQARKQFLSAIGLIEQLPYPFLRLCYSQFVLIASNYGAAVPVWALRRLEQFAQTFFVKLWCSHIVFGCLQLGHQDFCMGTFAAAQFVISVYIWFALLIRCLYALWSEPLWAIVFRGIRYKRDVSLAAQNLFMCSLRAE